LVDACHTNSVAHGFWDVPAETHVIPAKLMLIVSEVSEALEAHRNGDKANMGEELADIIIRVCDLAGEQEIDLGAEVLAKMAHNANRPYLHGKAY